MRWRRRSNRAADSIDFTLGLANFSGFTGPYASVDVNRTSSTTATITFTSLINGGYTYLMGDTSAADVNVNADSFTIGSITATNSISGFSPDTYVDNGSKNVDGFGTFNQTTKDTSGGFTEAADFISFVLTNTSATWADAASVLAANTKGFTAAAHVFACLNPCNTTEGAAITGFASNGEGVIPLPGTLPLFASGLAGLAWLGRRKKRMAAAEA